MMRIEGGGVVLERLVMRNVVSHRRPGDVHVGAATNRGPVRTPLGWSEAPLEPSPGDRVIVQEIAHVSPPIATVPRAGLTQSSYPGRGSPTIVLSITSEMVIGWRTTVAGWVCPAIRFSAPGVEGPKTVL